MAYIRSVPLAASVGKSAGGGDVAGAVERFREAAGGKLLDELARLFDESLRDEIRATLNTDDLDRDLPALARRFWDRLAPLLMELSYVAYESGRPSSESLREAEESLAEAVARALRRSGYGRAEDVVYGLSALVDRDEWILDKVAELGLGGLVSRLVERASDALQQLSEHVFYLTFAVVAAAAAVLGAVKEYRPENLDRLASLCRSHAEGVEDYLDTLDVLQDDEAYEDLRELGAIER